MKTLFTSIVLTAALAFSSMAQAGLIQYNLTDEMSSEIRTNGDYTLQNIEDGVSIEYWLYDQLAMLRFNAERINYIFYKPFVNSENYNFVSNVYNDRSKIASSYFEEEGYFEILTYNQVDYIDYVIQIDDAYEFNGLNFDGKSVLDDGFFTDKYKNLYFDTFSIAGLDFQEVGADNGNGSVDVPEPSTFGIFSLACFALVSRMRKRSNAKA